MSKILNTILGLISDNVQSVSIVNNGGTPQIVVTPKNTAKEILDAVNRGINGKEATQEGKQEEQANNQKVS